VPASTPTILFVTPECTPYAQAGGLGDVSSALPKALARQGFLPHVVMPLYREVDRSGLQRLPGAIAVPTGADVRTASLWRGRLGDDVPVYLLDQPALFDRDGIYGPNGTSFDDNLERFAFLSRAAFAVAQRHGIEPDIIHAHDWPTALAVLYAQERTPAVPSVLTLHNVGHQGRFPLDAFPCTGLPSTELSPQCLEHFGTINLLKGGILRASALTTVSPSYARDIQSPAWGCGLDGVLRFRSHDLHGILNGIDTEVWNPASDPWLPARFDATDLRGKAACKAWLQRAAGFAQRPEVPVFGVVSRLTHQKGLDVLARSLARILDLEVQFVLLGTGDPDAERFFAMASRVRSDRFHAWLSFDPVLAHRIEAGCDFFVMPSRYEPCGLNQLYSLRYGTLPVVRATGGLDDSVDGYDEATGRGTGFKFHDLHPQSMFDVIGWAVSTWYDRSSHIVAMRQAAMKRDSSWDIAASAYGRLYEEVLGGTSRRPFMRAG